MTAKEILLKLKKDFFDSASPTVPDTNPASVPPADTTTKTGSVSVFAYPLDGGDPIFVDCSDDGIADIDTGDPVYADPAMTTPYPDGTYKVTGTDFSFTVSGGKVSVVSDVDNLGPGAPLQSDGTMAAPITTDLKQAPAPPSIEQRIAAIEATLAKLATPSVPTGMAELKLASDKQEKTVKELFSLVEKLVALPTADPKTIPPSKKESFRDKKEREIERFAAAIAQNRKEKQNI